MQPETKRAVAGAIFFLTGAAIYIHAKLNAPDPYAVCAAYATDEAQAACRAQVGFALSAGW
jgi:hypothetical protein